MTSVGSTEETAERGGSGAADVPHLFRELVVAQQAAALETDVEVGRPDVQESSHVEGVYEVSEGRAECARLGIRQGPDPRPGEQRRTAESLSNYRARSAGKQGR